MDPDACPMPGTPEWEKSQPQLGDALRGLSVEETLERTDDEKRTKRRHRDRKCKSEQQDSFRETVKESEAKAADDPAEAKPRSKRRRRRRRKRPPPKDTSA